MYLLNRKFSFAALAAVFTIVTWSIVDNSAAAQIAPKKSGETVRTRPDAGLDAKGLHTGSVMILPSIGIAGVYNDNLFSQELDAEDDIALVVTPSVVVQSLWSRHDLYLLAEGAFGFQNDFSDEDTQTYTFLGEGTIEIKNSTNLVLHGAFRHLTEKRGDPDAAVGIAKPTEYDQMDGAFQFNHSFNRVTVTVGGGIRRMDYEDTPLLEGGLFDNQDRDRDRYYINARLGYDVQPDVGIFVDFAQNWRRYDEIVDDGGFMRNSEGYDIVLGVDLRFSNVIFGHAFIGYTEQKFDDVRFDNVSGVTFGADIDWNVSRSTSINFGAERTLNDTVEAGSPGYYADRATVRIDHELTRSLIVSAMGMIGQNDYQQIDRDDTVWNMGAEAEWTINRNYLLRLRYTHAVRDADFVGVDSYKENVVMFGIEAGY